MEENSFDVIVIGAGAAGLMAAWELIRVGRSVALIEAKERTGGRIHTIHDPDFELPVELGAEFIHGNLELTKLLLEKAKATIYRVQGDIWQKEEGEFQEQKDFIEDYSLLNNTFKELKQDISVAAFIENYLQDEKFEELRFTLKNYVEGYYAADTTKTSTFALRDELTGSDHVQYRIEGGYIKLIDFLETECRQRGVQFFLSHIVEEISWQKGQADIFANSKIFHAKKTLITVPIGVLQSEKIRFSPALPEKIKAVKQLGYGPVIKTIFQFEDAFWKNKELTQNKDLEKLSFIFSEAIIPTWWTHYPKKVGQLTGWSGGPHAEEIKDLSDEQILHKALHSLSSIFNIDIIQLQQKLKAWHVANWVNDPYSCGAYSYEVVNGKALRAVVKQPIDDVLFFAGEGLFDGPEIGTVEASLYSAREIAHQMIASFKN